VGLDGRCDPERIARVLRELDADIVGLQEVDAGFESGSISDQMQYLATATQSMALAGPTIQRARGPYGNVLLSRRPILKSRLFDLSVTGPEPRGAIDADADIDGEAVRVIVTHLGLKADERRYQVGRLLEILSEERTDVVVVLGDINEWLLGSRPLRWLQAHFGRLPAPPTFPARFPLLALDRIWVRPRNALIALHVHKTALTRMASDHLPLQANIAVDR
jgi:endonuclease/exonuclease/phosphatase family metal-dependent hydrolase